MHHTELSMEVDSGGEDGPSVRDTMSIKRGTTKVEKTTHMKTCSLGLEIHGCKQDEKCVGSLDYSNTAVIVIVIVLHL